MKRLRLPLYIGSIVLFMLLMVGCTSFRHRPQKKMNVILILADDLGASDTSLGKSTFHQTPNLDRLTQRGMYFSNAYSASPLCSPTRGSIMTGQSPARNGITAPNCHLPKVILKASTQASAAKTSRQTNMVSVNRLSTDHVTLAEVLKQTGYATAHFGKWHLGKEPYSPLEHGFDVDIPHWPGPGPAGSFVAPWKFKSFKEKYPKEHIEDRMGDEAVAFMEQHKDQPFYLNYWQFSVHAPFNAKEELIEEYRKKVDPGNPQQSPTYAAMVHSLDDNVGKILDAVDRLGIADHTLIVFYSDNGGNMYNLVDGTTATSNAPHRGGKASMYEGGIRVPAVFVWPGVIKGGTHSDALLQSEDLYATILDVTGTPQPDGQALDSISAVPALKGKSGSREAVYIYFPHSPSVPDHLSPSVAVREGDWKLIRIFHDSPDQTHRFELYNLKNDVGERNNLADQNPERVKRMDAMLDTFLVETAAVTPKSNPKYDPKASYRSKDWSSEGHVPLSAKDAGLQIRSFGEDPMVIQTTNIETAPGDYILELKLRSLSADGPGRIAWTDASNAFDQDESMEFAVKDDGLWHEHQLEFSSSKPINAIRIMPASTQGVVHMEWVCLKDSQGKLIKEWDLRISRKKQ